VTCVHNVSFDLHPGTVLALLGPNGAGKSTLLQTVAGLLPKLSGTCQLLGKPVSDYTPDSRARVVGYVPQDEAPQFAFTVKQTVLLGRLPHAETYFDSPEDEAIADEAMEQAECADLAQRSITGISGGERQRVWIARALAQKPQVLLMDEPTSHLDVQHALEAVRLVRRLADSGLAVVVAIHDLNLVSALADQAIVLKQGRVALQGACDEVLNCPDLDAVYGVRFHRAEVGGRLVLSPEISLTGC
jgi:iron complex transport system ATP-binding protein